MGLHRIDETVVTLVKMTKSFFSVYNTHTLLCQQKCAHCVRTIAYDKKPFPSCAPGLKNHLVQYIKYYYNNNVY